MRRSIGIMLSLTLLLSGCGPDKKAVETIAGTIGQQEVQSAAANGIPFEFQVNPETFELSFQVEEDVIPISKETGKYVVADYREEEGIVSWQYPKEDIKVAITPKSDYLSVEFTSVKDGDNTFSWPSISAEQYYLPFGEGKRVPAGDPAWKEYLKEQQFSVIEQLSMPFWIFESGEYSVLFIMEEPYRTQLDFSAEERIAFSVSHEYPEIDENKTSRYRIYITDKNPVHAAKLYRNYASETGNLVTLSQKEEQNPNVRKLYGAPFIYLWGDFVISEKDIDWAAFRQSMDMPAIKYLYFFSGEIENGKEFENVMAEIRQQDYVEEYQKNVICSYISLALKQENFWDPVVFKERSDTLNSLLQEGYENLSVSDKIQVHKYALAANLPGVLNDAGSWMNDSTVELLEEMKESGIAEAWLGLNSWEQAYAKPEMVEKANELGYLIASYDSYHSIHEPGNEKWITAQFSDTSLYDEATVTDKNGQKENGFQNVGRKLNPVLSLPSVKERMGQIMSNPLSFNSWFIDCDATGEIYDDYTPEHITTQEEDLSARLERMSYIRDQYHFVIGSEGGNDFSVPDIAYAHGIELKSFSWMDEDMKSNKDSEYYIGGYYNPKGGTAAHFSKRIPVKEQYYTVFVDPKYDVPLFKLVYNDSVITSYHWDWSTFKIQGATQDRMLREVLYNVPPLYHLDREEWEKYKQDIISHQAVWSDFSKEAVTREMTDFAYLAEDGSVQKTVYGDELMAVANFGDTVYQYGKEEIPAHSVYINQEGQEKIYTPSLQEKNR